MPKAFDFFTTKGKVSSDGSQGNASPLDEIEINGLADNKTHHSVKSSLYNEKFGGVTLSVSLMLILHLYISSENIMCFW